jgi:hypothetical protein
MAEFFDAVERAQMCDLLDELGPQAPTLLDLWTTRDIAAHLVLRERDPLSGHGLALPGAWNRVAQRRQNTLALTDFAAHLDAAIGTTARLLPHRMGAPGPQPQRILRPPRGRAQS